MNIASDSAYNKWEMRETKAAFVYAWLAISILLLTAALVPFALPERILARAVPVCSARAAGGSCLLCGMTTGFYAISRGDWAQAAAANAGAAPLYGIFVVNGFFALRKGWRTRCKF